MQIKFANLDHSVLPRNFIEGDKCPTMSSKCMHCGTEPLKQGTSDEHINKQIQISWDYVHLHPN